MTARSGLREVGRPRLYSDEAIFAAVHLVIRRDGYHELTLESVALEVGCTRQALVRRFGSKRRMLLAALDATAAKISSDYSHIRKSWNSPLAALRARMVLPPHSRPEETTDIHHQANLMAFVVSSSADPEFSRRFIALQQVARAEVEKLLHAAVEQGELAPVDIETLADALLAATAGETVLVTADSSLDHAAMMATTFEEIIGPYRRATPS